MHFLALYKTSSITSVCLFNSSRCPLSSGIDGSEAALKILSCTEAEYLDVTFALSEVTA